MDGRFSRLRGFPDLYGDDVYLFEVIESTFRKYAKLYGFEEIKLPILERSEVFIRSIGEGSDIVRKEMFSFEDKGGRNVSMRPEGTAGVVRAFLENNFQNNPKYYKLFYLGPMFRAERPQAGRLRQFHQAGVEWFGSDNPLVDFETISLLWEIMSELGISNSLELAVNSVGCAKCVPKYKEKLEGFFDANYGNFCSDCRRRREANVLRVFDCKNELCQKTLEGAPKVKDELCEVCQYHLDTLTELLEKYNIPFVVDDRLVRGLDYYTRNVFEVRCKSIGVQNAIAGGGRYNNLVSEFGGPEIPAFGFAMGIERTILVLRENSTFHENLSVGVGAVSQSEIGFSLEIARMLREKGIITHTLFHAGELKKQIKLADKIGVRITIIVGEDEIKENAVTVKDMATGNQEMVAISQLFDRICINSLRNQT